MKRRFAIILGLLAMGLLISVGVWRFKTPPDKTKSLGIVVTYVGVTNDPQGNVLVSFRIYNPYAREIFYVAPRWGNTNNHEGPWQFPYKLLGARQSEVVHIPPPVINPGTNVWRVKFIAGVTQDRIERFTDGLADKMRRAPPKQRIYMLRMQGVGATPNDALFSAVVEGDPLAVSKAIADGAMLDFRRGWTMLHLNAMYGGSTNVAAVLLQKGVNAFALDRDGDSAAQIAKRNGYADLASLLEDRTVLRGVR